MQLCALQMVVAQQDTTFVDNFFENQDTILISSDIKIPDTIVVEPQPPQARGRNATNVIVVTDDFMPMQTTSIVNRRGDPMKATMLAVVLPGAGQIYNKKYWKLPVVYAGFGALIYAIKFNSDQHQLYYKGYMDFTDDIKETNSYLNLKFLSFLNPELYDHWLQHPSYEASLADKVEAALLRMVDYHKRYRDLSMILTGAWYLIQILDANVDASLMNYNVSDNLELALSPKMFNMPGMQSFTGLNLRFTYTF
jgi:hypothetical protein